MSTYGPRFITPPQENEERSPYRPVWRSLLIESGLLLIVVAIAFIMSSVLNVNLPEPTGLYIGVGIALTPCLLWFILTVRAEQRAIEPRQSLLTIFTISALAANALGLPIINQVLQVDKWLPLSDAINRIFGYAVTVGIVQETIKYLVLRYTVWPHNFRTRLDGIAYGVAAGIGYATVLNLDFIALNAPVTLEAIALRVFGNYALHISTCIIVSYGLAEVRFSNPNPVFLTFTLAISALITGIVIPIRAGLVNAAFTLLPTAPRPLLGLGFSVALLIVVIVVVSTLINNADRREQEAKLGQEE
jgi:RsiW-degrading membrane proteinase PrsW (M82 family)